MDYDGLLRALDVLYICAMMIERGIWTSGELNFTLHSDDYYEAAASALESCCENVFGDYDEDNEIEHMYFSDPVMLDYYRLCREYGSRRGMKLKDNPYVMQAARYVCGKLDGGYSAYYILHTKINHACASGIHFMYDCYFDSQMELLERMLDIMDFYRAGVKKLKTELAKPTALAVIIPWPMVRREAA